jgi:hypothetical protein
VSIHALRACRAAFKRSAENVLAVTMLSRLPPSVIFILRPDSRGGAFAHAGQNAMNECLLPLADTALCQDIRKNYSQAFSGTSRQLYRIRNAFYTGFTKLLGSEIADDCP